MAFDHLAADPSEDPDNCHLLAISGLIDRPFYIQQAGLPPEADAEAHYLAMGWRAGLRPKPEFDAHFLQPYYEAAGRMEPPALTWLALSVMPGRMPPMNLVEASYVADRVRGSAFFDTNAYGLRLPSGLDPALHYSIIGEQLGWQPSSQFDPLFYLDRHPDVARLRLSPLDHYVEMGAREGRRASPAVRRLAFPAVKTAQKPCVLLLVHDASRTGAPVLGWNIARGLTPRYNVVTVMMRGGDLEPWFVSTSAAAIGPLVWEEWHRAEFERLAVRLVETYTPRFVVANSVETSALVPSLGRLGLPVVALIHEFAAYIRPSSKISDMLSWAGRVVFPAEVVADAARRAFPALAWRQDIHILSQGRTDVPRGIPGKEIAPDPATSQPARADGASPFVVLGLGTVHIRKGVDLFIAAANAAVRAAPDISFRFIWFGGGYDPENDVSYSVYLAAQIAQSGLDDVVEIRNEVEDLSPAYAGADVFLMSSRLDPQPNVGIEAVMRGLPTVCFEGACGTAEILQKDPATSCLVVPHLDSHAAAEVICRLARNPAELRKLRAETARVGAAAYDLDAYVQQIGAWGEAVARSAPSAADLQELAAAGVVDPELALPPGQGPGPLLAAERHVMQQWSVVGASPDQNYNRAFRRACAGFNQQAYADHIPGGLNPGQDPVLHWIRAGRPPGPWSHVVFEPGLSAPVLTPSEPILVHAYLEHASSIELLRLALDANRSRCSLDISTIDEGMAALMRRHLASHAASLQVHILAGPVHPLHALMTSPGMAGMEERDRPTLHLHDVLDPHLETAEAEAQRAFMWENLIGLDVPMLDLATAALAADQRIGLLIAEHPGMDGWCGYREDAEHLARGVMPDRALPKFFDYPRGGMFIARTAVMDVLRTVPNVAHVAESRAAQLFRQCEMKLRLLPILCQHVGLKMAGLRLPGTTC